MQAYRINEWVGHYEVNIHGKTAAADTVVDNLRKTKLSYIRSKNYGHSLGASFRRMNKVAWQYGNQMQGFAFGLFHKLLEIAGDQDREYRGWILDEKQKPMMADQIAELLDWDPDIVKCGLKILTDEKVGWVNFAEFSNIPPISPSAGEKGGALWDSKGESCRGERGSLQEEKETEIEANINERGSSASLGISVSGSGLPGEKYLSVPAKRKSAIMRVCEVLRVNAGNKSDITVMRDIFDQLQQRIECGECNLEIFDAVIDEARSCGGVGKMGKFINAMKRERFGYKPVGRSFYKKVKEWL